MDYREKCIIETIEKMMRTQHRLMDFHKKTLMQLNAGKLVIRKRKGKPYYSEIVGNTEMGITKDLQRRHEVIHAHYLEKEIQNLQATTDILKRTLNELEKFKPKEIHPQVAREDVAKAGYSFEDWQWMKGNFETNPFHQEALCYQTLLGIMLRSKSELNIANTLERLKIPYRYEQKLFLADGVQYPDFTILRPDRNIVLWEHNGLMEDLDYAEKASFRTRRYEESGYRQHRNLIVTYEDDIRTPRQIEEIIKRYILF